MLFSSSVVVDMGSIQQVADGAGAIVPPARPYAVVWPDGAGNESGNIPPDAHRSGMMLPRPNGMAAPNAAASTTLAKFYRSFFRPEYLLEVRRVKPQTVSLYDDAIAWWETLTGDPLLTAINDKLCSQFVEQLEQQPGRRDKTLSLLTVKKHCRNLQAILTRCGPKIRGVKCCQNLIAEVPTLETKRWRGRPRNSDFSVDELRAVLANCQSMNTPDEYDPPTWWRAFVLFAYHTGLRIGALMRVRWDHFDADGWLVVPDSISKGGSGIRLWIHPDALAAIVKLSPDRKGPILPWPSIDAHGIGNLRSRWKRLLRIADIPAHRRFGFHSIRKTCSMVVRRIDRDAADIILGHATSIRQIHYSDRDRILADAIAKMERLIA